MIECPVIPLRGTVAFPHIPMTLELERKMSVAAFEEAYKNGSYILLLAQTNPLDLNLRAESFASVGTVCIIRQFLKLPNGNVRIVVNGEARADVISLKAPHHKDGVWHSSCVMVHIYSENNTKACALREETLDAVMDYIILLPNYSKELISEGKMNFTEISDSLGFSSLHYFSKTFKKLTGITPSEYEKGKGMFY